MLLALLILLVVAAVVLGVAVHPLFWLILIAALVVGVYSQRGPRV